MGKQFGNKRSVKGPKKAEKFDHGRRGKKARCVEEEEELARGPSPSSSEENEEIASEDEVAVHTEPSTYDKLLNLLSSSGKSVLDAINLRRSEEERNDEEDDGADEDSELLEEVNDETEGSDDELQEPGEHGIGEKSEGSENESASDEDHDSLSDDEYSEASMNQSSFNTHMEHELSKTELDNLSTQKSKYKWDVPASGMPNCKWVGTGECFLKNMDIDDCSYIKPKLHEHWLNVFKSSGSTDLSSSKKSFFALCNSYRDILHGNKKPFYLRGSEEDSSIRDGYLMHTLNHVFKTRDLVLKNDANLANNASLLDQGFTRPKVLIILPLASIALRVVKRLIQLSPLAHKGKVEKIDRFYKEFGTEKLEDNEEESGIPKPQKTAKPSDFESLFGGNNNDHFVFGIKFTKRTIKLFSDFYSSDIIVASALGLLTKIGQAERLKEKDVDYLSSIEVLVIDYAEVIAMQNWSNLLTVVKQMNLLPSKQHQTDVLRIRPWYLEGNSKYYRQTIMLSSYIDPEMNALFNNQCFNYQGKVKLECEHKGVIPKVHLQVQQIYQRFSTDSVANIDDARLEYFSTKVFPKLKDSMQGGIMIFISSYFDFVRVRNFLKSQDASFCLISEYTKPSDISRARNWFFEGKRTIMLYTERTHFYHRYKIRGVKNLFFYSLPERKEFYPEVVNMLEGSDNGTSTALFSRFDQFKMERIVGKANAKKMMKSEKDMFVFC